MIERTLESTCEPRSMYTFIKALIFNNKDYSERVFHNLLLPNQYEYVWLMFKV